MGNYQEVLKKQPPALRELENTPTRLHMFGNPFKVNKQVLYAQNIDSVKKEIQTKYFLSNVSMKIRTTLSNFRMMTHEHRLLESI